VNSAVCKLTSRSVPPVWRFGQEGWNTFDETLASRPWLTPHTPILFIQSAVKFPKLVMVRAHLTTMCLWPPMVVRNTPD